MAKCECGRCVWCANRRLTAERNELDEANNALVARVAKAERKLAYETADHQATWNVLMQEREAAKRWEQEALDAKRELDRVVWRNEDLKMMLRACRVCPSCGHLAPTHSKECAVPALLRR